MNNANMGKPDEKFLFNVNVFDADVEEEVEVVEDLPPPPPVFSLEELEAAKKKAFAEGRAQAEAESKASRAQHLANLLDVVAREMTMLFASEDLREQSYEFEAVRLSEQIFNHVFPLYAEAIGFEELKAAIRQIIAAHNGSGLIRVTVNPDMAEGTEKFLEQLTEKNPDLRFVVKGDAGLAPGACSLNWDHGGALRDTEAMALQIKEIIKDALAARGATGHDSESGDHEPDNKGDSP